MQAPATVAAILGALALAGCAPDDPPPIPIVDAHFPDGGTFDAGPIRVRDAGPPGPAIDGELDEAEWEDALVTQSAVATDRPGSTLVRLLALIEHGHLFLAVEGTVADGDSIVVYVDRDPGGPEGIADPATLSDVDGALDIAIAQPTLDVAGFAMDFAWATTRMPHNGRLDGTIGWRDVASDPSAFAWIADGVRSACGEEACETTIPLATLGGTAPRTITLFARIVRADGGFTNQTLPEDDAAQPDVVRALLTVEEEPPMPDGGMPDGGTGPGEIVVDGVVDEPAWASARIETNDIPAAGAFAGNALHALRALRDEARLYLAIEADLTGGNAILVYIDRDLDGESGLVLDTGELNDRAGELDEALSKFIFTPELRIDAAWGTLNLSRTAAGVDPRMGWRDMSSATDFRAIDSTVAPSACSADACEASILISDLGAAPGDTIALAVRLGSATRAALSNQMLPMDLEPEYIRAYVTLPP